MTSTQTNPGGNGVDIPSLYAIDAVKRQSEIAQSARRHRRSGTHGRGPIPRSPGPRRHREAHFPARATGTWSSRTTASPAGTGNRGR